MRFTEFLVEAPMQFPGGYEKRRVRPVRGKYPNLKAQDQYVAPNLKLFSPKPQPQAKPRINQQTQPLPGNPKNAKTADPWQKMIMDAGRDQLLGRELMTLLGAMYQAKRRNPAVQLTLPKMVSSMPEGDEKQRAMKAKMVELYGMAKDEDLAHIAARASQLQKGRSIVNTNGQVQNSQPKTQGTQSMLQQINTIARTASIEDLQKARDELSTLIKNKKPRVKQPMRGPTPVIATS